MIGNPAIVATKDNYCVMLDLNNLPSAVDHNKEAMIQFMRIYYHDMDLKFEYGGIVIVDTGELDEETDVIEEASASRVLIMGNIEKEFMYVSPSGQLVKEYDNKNVVIPFEVGMD